MKTLSLLMLCLSVCASAGDEAAMRFKGGVLHPDPAQGLDMVSDSVRGADLLLLQFAALPSPETLARNGVVPLYDAGDNTLYALVPTGFHIDDFAELTWMGRLPAGLKVAGETVAALFADDAPQNLLVYGFPGMAAQDLADRIAEAGGIGTIRPELPGYVQLVTGDMPVVQALSRMPDITWIGQAPADQEMVHLGADTDTPYGPVAPFAAHDIADKADDTPVVDSLAPAAPSAYIHHECLDINDMFWNSVSGATSYKVYSSTSSSVSTATLWQTVSYTMVTAWTDWRLYLWVKACNSSGCSGYSNRVMAYYTPEECP